AHDAGVVHQDVEAPEGVDRLGDHLAGGVVVGDVRVVRHGFAATALDDVDGQIGVATFALTLDRATEVVDDDLCAVLGELQRMPSADAVAGSGDDRDLAVQHAHVC